MLLPEGTVLTPSPWGEKPPPTSKLLHSSTLKNCLPTLQPACTCGACFHWQRVAAALSQGFVNVFCCASARKTYIFLPSSCIVMVQLNVKLTSSIFSIINFTVESLLSACSTLRSCSFCRSPLGLDILGYCRFELSHKYWHALNNCTADPFSIIR